MLSLRVRYHAALQSFLPKVTIALQMPDGACGLTHLERQRLSTNSALCFPSCTTYNPDPDLHFLKMETIPEHSATPEGLSKCFQNEQVHEGVNE